LLRRFSHYREVPVLAENGKLILVPVAADQMAIDLPYSGRKSPGDSSTPKWLGGNTD
jgi:hypothetical protein